MYILLIKGGDGGPEFGKSAYIILWHSIICVFVLTVFATPGS